MASGSTFLSTRSDQPQVYRLHVRGGDAEPVTDLPVPVHGFRLAKDGSALVVWLATHRACGVDFGCMAKRSGRANSATADTAAGRARNEPQTDTAPTRHGLFLLPLNDDGLLGGAPVAITAEFDTDVPARGSDMSAVALSDNASVVAFVVGDELVTFEPRTGRYRNLTGDDAGHVSSPLYLAGGDLVWLAKDPADLARWPAPYPLPVGGRSDSQCGSGMATGTDANWSRRQSPAESSPSRSMPDAAAFSI